MIVKSLELVFREAKAIDGGTFISDDGKSISYDGYLRVSCDFLENGKVVTRNFRIDKDNVNLVSALQNMNPSDSFLADIDVITTVKNSCKLFIIQIF